MAGFILETAPAEELVDALPLRLIDFGECEVEQTLRTTGARAFWVAREGSSQLFVGRWRNRFLLIEGQVDRYPVADEPLENWLPGRWGSFRGFEVDTAPSPRTTVFVDPLGTRPVFFVKAGRRFLASDKLSSLALNCPGMLEPNWGALLEAAALGALYSTDCTVQAAVAVKPGEVVQLGGREAQLRFRYQLPDFPDLAPADIRTDPAGSLLVALGIAVSATWTDPASWLLLSGGLDSRTVLALGGPGRKALTITTRDNRESHVARQIAESCGAQFRHSQASADRYCSLLKSSFLLMSAAADPQQAHHLDLTRAWRAMGIGGVATGYLFDTVLKGSRFYRSHSHVSPYISLRAILGDRAIYFSGKRSGRHYDRTSDLLSSVLTADGNDLFRRRLTDLVTGIEPLVSDGFDLTMERLVLRWISKSMDYPSWLAWIEGQDVQTPGHHPALWAWHRSSRPGDRYNEKALTEVVRAMKHPVGKLINANTGELPTARSSSWRDLLIGQPWYPLARDLWHRTQGLIARREETLHLSDEGSWPPLASVFRTRDGLDTLTEGLAPLSDTGLFNRSEITRVFQRFQAGDDRLIELLMVLSGVGRWIRFLRDPMALSEAGPSGVRILRSSSVDPSIP